MNDFPQNILQLLQQQMALTGRLGASGGRVTPAVATGAPANIIFTQPGYVLGLYGSVEEGTPAAFAATRWALLINGEQNFWVDGQGGPASASFLGSFGGANNWYPVMRRVVKGDQWTFTFTGSGTNPSIELAMWNDADIEAMRQAAKR